MFQFSFKQIAFAANATYSRQTLSPSFGDYPLIFGYALRPNRLIAKPHQLHGLHAEIL